MPSKKYKVSSQLVEIDPRAVEVPSWARKIAREYLEESVKERGIIAPIVVGRIREGNKTRFILIDGAGRLSLAVEKGLDLIPARIFDIESENDALFLSIELEQTKEPWSLEYTIKVIKELLDKQYTKTVIAKLLKIPRSKVYRLLAIASFPEKLQRFFLDETYPIRLADEISALMKEVGEETFMKKFLWYLEDFEPTKAIRATIDSLKKIKISEPEIEEVLEEEEEKITPEAETVPAGTEQKLIPASEIEVPEEVEEVEVVEEEEEEEVKRIPAEKVMLYHALKDAVNALNDAINDLQAASEYIHSDPEKSAAIFEYMRKIAEIRDIVEDFLKKVGEDLE